MAQPPQSQPPFPAAIPPPIFFPGAPVPLPGVPPPPLGVPLVPQVPPIPVPKQSPCTTPNSTLYVNNLNEKVKIPGMFDSDASFRIAAWLQLTDSCILKKTLESVFKQYGEILDIIAHANVRLRGQAFVVFKDEESATRALKEVQHFVIYNKPMVIQYARTKSDAVAQIEGSLEEHKKKRLEEKEKRKLEGPTKMAVDQPASNSFPPTQSGKLPSLSFNLSPYTLPLLIHFSFNLAPLFFPGYSTGVTSAQIPDEYLPPNKILFLQNLPDGTTDAMLATLFQQYPGFREVRMVPGKTGIAFVEYDAEPQATVAKDNLNGFQISPTHQVKVTFAKK
ncbi:RNA-binding domain-containing protein [Endogone sp. FLAS-F59071]|nr:RNA-binding domain-containing protein [Endogone sp. FLAS-F59071]|eukprot:RUS16860.1 RNA-binding domain-containing protein [Endogone sp. FLAS-F59071]